VKLPTIFVAHGSPFTLTDEPAMAELATWGRALPRPQAILMLSAHWEKRPLTVGATATVPLVYDFSGFPRELYRIQYPAPGAPALAERVRQLLAPLPVASDPGRGLDHGAWVPLLAMFPGADVPVLQISLPTLEPRPLVEIGRALAPLRREGVLIAGSGFLVHNLRAVDLRPGAPTLPWAVEFDAWAADAIARRDLDALVDYRARAPHVERALPTHEHFVPLFLALGASDENDAVSFPITGITMGSLTKRSVQLG
jgi:4,5-DOPA dioxygenase extradiol